MKIIILGFQKLYRRIVNYLYLNHRDFLLKSKNRVPLPVKKLVKRMLAMKLGNFHYPVKKVFQKPWNKSPLISVIIPNRNYGQFLEEALDSILCQTFQNFEIIIVDKSDEQYTLEILKKIQAQKNPKIRIVEQKKPGLSAARNEGIRLATGKYICCLDADDYIGPAYFEKVLYVLEAKLHLGFAYPWVKIFGDETGIWKPQNLDIKNIVFFNQIPIAAIFRREAWKQVGGFSEVMKEGYEDWEFWVKISKLGWRGEVIPEILFNYRRHGVTRDVDAQKKHHNLKKRIQKLHPQLLRKRYVRGIVNNYVDIFSKNPFINFQEEDFIIRKNKKNIVIAMPWMTFGGAETLLYNYCKELKDDFNISFVTALESKNEWEHKFKEITPNIFHLPSFLFNDDQKVKFMINYIRMRKIDILHIVHNNCFFYILPCLKKEFPSLKIVNTLFNTKAAQFKESLKYGKYITTYTSDNKKVIDALKRELPNKRNNLFVIPNGIDCFEIFNPAKFDRNIERGKLGIKDQELAVFFIGRLSEEKGPDIFLEVAKKVIKEHKDVKFFIIGNGPMEENITRTINKINSQNLVYLDYQTEIARYISSADVFILSSKIEGFPLSILEAMAMEVVVVASNVGGVSDIIDDGENGFLINKLIPNEFADKLELLYNDKDLLKRISKSGRATVKTKFSTQILADNYKKLYLNL